MNRTERASGTSKMGWSERDLLAQPRMEKSVTRIKKAQVRPDWMLGNSQSTPKTERAAELTAGAWEIEKNVTGVQENVSNLGDLNRLFAQIMREKGKLDIVFANAGVATYAPFGKIAEKHLSYWTVS